jgi:hypothetical protein
LVACLLDVEGELLLELSLLDLRGPDGLFECDGLSSGDFG